MKNTCSNCLTPGHRHSIFCVLPPYILDQIILNGEGPQRERALRARSVDNTFRAFRLSVSARSENTEVASFDSVGSVVNKSRTIFTAGGVQTLPGRVVRSEGDDPTGDEAVDEAYDGLGATFDFFYDVFGRNSIDNQGLPLLATVHFGQDYDNAFWNSQQMVFGDGDSTLFNRFTIALDVIGHELAHGVTEDESGLQYFGQSGALNESLSDVFGSLIKQKVLGQDAASADWLIGAGLLADGVQGQALRSMSDPGSAYDDPVLGQDPQPGHMDDFVETFADNGGVHINSGIPNRAFYLAATKIGGFAWEKAGVIWYKTLISPQLRPNADFQRFATITFDVAGALYGTGSPEQVAVQEAWDEVGITV